MSRHRLPRPDWLRRVALAVVISGFLILVAVTYPHPSGLVMPPGQGTYQNFDPAPAQPTLDNG